MASDPYEDLLQYLGRIERLLLGWSVLRQFQTNSLRFEKWVLQSGPRAAVRASASQTYGMYAWACVVTGVAFSVAGLGTVAMVLYVSTAACVALSAVRAVGVFRPQREYRRARRASGE